MKPLILAMFAVALLVSLTAETEAGVSFHPRLKEKDDNSSGNSRKSNPKRQLYEDVSLQMKEGQSDSAVAQAGIPSQLGLRKSKADSAQYTEQMLQMLSALLGSDDSQN
uniref:Preproghrelin n=1 Tax=Sphyrna lewini TaxID=7823 RepID=Q08KB6_SPHLE|nr:preproghrelin [Sphyrna lewini]BAF33106.1 preproghrelin [Sphyrna lewini]